MERRLKPFPMPSPQPPSESSQPGLDEAYLPHYPISKRPKQRWLKWLIAGVVLLLCIGVGGYILHLRHSTTPKQSSSTTHTVQPTQNTSNQQALAQYTSNGQDLNLSFSYPSDWSVNPTTNNNASDQPITVTSPLMTIESASNQSGTGKVVVSIRPGSAQISELATGNATAGQASAQIGYSHPLSSQQQYPYLSFINLSGGTNASGGFQEVIITGQQQFSQGQNISADGLSGLDPIISARFYSCSTQACSGSGEAPLSISMNTWQNNAPFIQVLALIQSLQLH